LGAFLKRNHLSILSNDEVYNIHIATLEILERTGVSIREKARNRVKQILASHKPEPVDPTIWKKVEIIIKDIEKRELGG